MAEKKLVIPEGPEPEEYKRSRWRHGSNVLKVLIIVILNIGLVGSAIDRHNQGFPLKWQQELLTGIFVLFCDVTILIPTILEADAVTISDDKITIKCLFFKRSIAWTEITEFRSPNYVRIATLRTRRGFYLLNKRTLPGYEQLEKTIRQHTGTQLKTV
jgi:Bacterial PH domain